MNINLNVKKEYIVNLCIIQINNMADNNMDDNNMADNNITGYNDVTIYTPVIIMFYMSFEYILDYLVN